jgi:hypothetical protein
MPFRACTPRRFSSTLSSGSTSWLPKPRSLRTTPVPDVGPISNFPRAQGPAVEDIEHGVHSIYLVLLLVIELDLQTSSTNPSIWASSIGASSVAVFQMTSRSSAK